MKLFLKIMGVVCIFLIASGFTTKDTVVEFETEEIPSCSSSSTKTYMDYRKITSKGSTQYKYIQDYMTVDEETGLLLDEDGFIGVALGSYYGSIGDRYYITLDSGVILPVVKIEEKANAETDNGCYHYSDNSVIEFVIDTDIAAEYFGRAGNNLIRSGNFNNDDNFKGKITKVEKVTGEKIDPDEIFVGVDEFKTEKAIRFDELNLHEGLAEVGK